MKRLLNENLRPIAQAANELPGRPNCSALWRWYTHGIRGVKLETVLIGGRRFTSREALGRFFEGVSGQATHRPAPAEAQRTPDDAVKGELDALRI